MKATRCQRVLWCAGMAVLLGIAGCAAVPEAPATEGGDSALGRLDFRKVIKEAKNKVFPAVVFIKCVKETHERGKKISQEVAGSGVIISPEGELLTNWHVVDKAIEIRCLLFDGRHFEAEVFGKNGTDKDTDLALLKLKLPADLDKPIPYATMGDSTKLKEGDFVMAMGAPWGMSRSVSIGIVSCTRRFLPGHSEYSLWLQTDAAISPGNSGGPLVNTDGEIVGINTRAVMWGGDMGFAIPSDTIAHVVAQLRESGKMNWSWTGLQLQPLKDFNKNVYFDAEEGVIVSETDPESPARRAGIQVRDRIVRINGRQMTGTTEEDLPDIRVLLGLMPKGQPAEIELIRDGKTVTVTLVPREKGKVEGEELDCPRWDMTVKAINQFDNPNLYFHRQKGVFVYGIKYPGNAQEAGLEQKDILNKIDGVKISTLEDVKKVHKKLIDNVKARHKVLVSVLRNGLLQQVVLDFSRDYEKE